MAGAGAAGLLAGAGATLGSAFVESLLTIDTGRPQRKIRYQFVYPDGSVAPAPPGFRGARGESQHCFDDETLKETLMFAALNMRGPPLSLHSQGPLTDAQLSLMTLDEKRHPIDVMGGTFDPHFNIIFAL